jgi:guanylate kinase
MEKNDPKLLEAVKIAQNILKTSAKKIQHNTASSVNNFLMAASNGQTAKKLKEKDIEKIINIAKSIK